MTTVTFTPYPNLLTHQKRTKWGTERDTQRERVYIAQSSVKAPIEMKLTHDGAQSLVDLIIASDYWRLIPNTPTHITVIRSKGYLTCTAYTAKREIRLAHWGYQYKTVLHELAHFLVPEPHADHGALFCARLLQLYTIVLGTSLSERLRLAFDLNNVQYS